MSKTITLYSDEFTISEFEDISKKLKKNKSALFRDMVKFFADRKDNLTNGLRIEVD